MERKIIEKAVEIYIEDTNEKINESKLNRAINIAMNMYNMDYQIDLDNGLVSINNTIINSQIFDEDLIDYCFYDRLTYIDELIVMIADASNSSSSRRISKPSLIVMKELLFTLIGWNDDEILVSTTDYKCLSPTINEDEFNTVCQQILDLNSTL